ncbi:hypothetical protein [Enterococcus cecorum]|uniref:hypothetical protein n=1 Tax=Enterococcus cecorum TaxID=44008 RepID=UPI000643AC15|nr:hypothetical protein [Enterococcus cecorum]KLO72136.1 hypothetical protein AA988_03655 [Enterococcus cecorum]
MLGSEQNEEDKEVSLAFTILYFNTIFLLAFQRKSSTNDERLVEEYVNVNANNKQGIENWHFLIK